MKEKEKKKKRTTPTLSVISKACRNKPGRSQQQATSTDRTACGGGAYLLLDVAVGHGDGTGGSVQEVLVGCHLTRLHGSPSGPQLLLTE